MSLFAMRVERTGLSASRKTPAGFTTIRRASSHLSNCGSSLLRIGSGNENICPALSFTTKAAPISSTVQGKGVAACYSITSSARMSRDEGTVRPRALAVWRLMTNSRLVGNSIGKS
jgi:hypothetical protein